MHKMQQMDQMQTVSPTDQLKGASVPQEGSPQPSTFFTWATFAKVLVAAAGAIAAALHFIGQVAYDSWLSHWGLDSGMLPLDTSLRFHYGYRAILESVFTLLTVSGWLLAAVFIATCAQFWLSSLLKHHPPERSKIAVSVKHKVRELPVWLRSFFAAIGLSGILVALLYYLVAVTLIVLAAAPAIGESAAAKWAHQRETRIEQGCGRNGGHGVCVQIARDGKVIGTGLILASSTSYLAYFDLATKRSRLVKLEGVELTGWVP